MNAGAVLGLFEQTGALLNGHFELRSGLHSDRFFQCAHVLCNPRVAARLSAALARKARRVLGAQMDGLTGVIAPAMGGLFVGQDVARTLDVRSIFAEKQDGRLVLRRFAINPGERYLVAEDVVTRGGRVQETIDLVKGAGGVVAGVCVLVDRSGGKAAFECPMVSLVAMEPVTWAPGACPLCRQGLPLVHPGS